MAAASTGTTASGSASTSGSRAGDDIPLLVRLLAGNPATSAAILGFLNTADATRLRRLHTSVAAIVAGVPWCDTSTPVLDAVRWRAALPAAVGARLSQRPAGGMVPPALAALAGVTHLDLRECEFVTDELLLHLPPSLCTLNVRSCTGPTERASFAHLTALTVLDCSFTWVGVRRVVAMPASLQELDITSTSSSFPGTASLAHLARLRVLRANETNLNAATLASLPVGLLELHAARCSGMSSPGASFARLPALRTLDVSQTGIGDGALATLSQSLVCLNASECRNLTPDAVLPLLPALRLLDVSGTRVGDALVASLPVGLTELRMSRCADVTAGATLDHVRALQVLHIYETGLAPGVFAACRARGCAVPVVGVLRGHEYRVLSFALLPDGRLVSGDAAGEVRVWDVKAGGSEAGACLRTRNEVSALVALRDGHRLVAGVADGCVEIWEVGVVPPVRTATVPCSGTSMRELTVQHDGRVAVGCHDGKVRIIDVDAGAVPVAVALEGHSGRVHRCHCAVARRWRL